MNERTRQQEIEDTAREILKVTESSAIMNLRFLQCAIAALDWEPRIGSGMIMANGVKVFYDPALIIRKYKNEQSSVLRLYLHILFHFVFHHNYQYEEKRNNIWDLACDIAVENTIMDIGLYQTRTKADPEREIKLKILKERAGGLHAAALYRLFLIEEPSIRETEDLMRLFKVDEHNLWIPEETIEVDLEQWKKIAERIKADLKSFSKGRTDSEALKAALEDATREKVDFGDFLRRFMVSRENIHINDEEFDYIYYTYGLSTYGNMPLVEPLEYADVRKIKEFVIAIDTSASCKGELVTAFLRRTISIMSDANNFFNHYAVHILQCDSEVRSDIIVHDKEELEAYINNIDIQGFGSTDFRPVFEYVDDQIEAGEIKNLKGLIYFTDGYGVYPDRMPNYDTAFVFVKDDGNAPGVPTWAIQIVLDEDQVLKAEEDSERKYSKEQN